jgi:hypothetical protein
MQGQRKQQKPDVGIGYKATYKDKQGNEQGYIKLMLRVDELNALASEDGMIKLSVFPQLGEKKKPNSPDVVVKPSMQRAQASSTKGSSHVAAAASTSKFPF